MQQAIDELQQNVRILRARQNVPPPPAQEIPFVVLSKVNDALILEEFYSTTNSTGTAVIFIVFGPWLALMFGNKGEGFIALPVYFLIIAFLYGGHLYWNRCRFWVPAMAVVLLAETLLLYSLSWFIAVSWSCVMNNRCL
jgi:hypothetical protein